MVEVRVYYLSNKESEFVSIDMHEAKIAVEFTLILFQINLELYQYKLFSRETLAIIN